MPITYWKNHKSPLSPEEVDANFAELESRVASLEHPKVPYREIANIALDGNKLIFEGIEGIKFPPLTLPILSWRPRGEWKPEHPYFAWDVIAFDGSLYVCEKSHVSRKEDIKMDGLEAIYWTLLVKKMPIKISEEILAKEAQLGDLMMKKDKKGQVRPADYDWKSWIFFAIES